ncbi:MAG TPA: ribulose-phosphate 3-epimerase [Gaiellaceae bacterium]|nr:ribulose-phosphate 3-epimerase [Gaiellaceae bacterium]
MTRHAHAWTQGTEIEPSLYAADFARLGEQVEELLDAGVRVFHFDVGDGHFVEPITIGPVVLRAIAGLVHARDAVLDCHLMVENPERHIPQIAEAGGDGVTFHYEATDDPERVAELARGHGLCAGLAFNPGTAVADAARAGASFDLVLCMSIWPGYSGQDFLPESYERIAELRGALPAEVAVQVDGGVTAENVAAIREAGANLIVAGSSVFAADDPPAAYRALARSVA